MKPKFRCGTRKAIEELSEELNLRFDSSLQDWSYTQGHPNDIEKYLSHYILTDDDDKKFVLMEIIIQSMEDQLSDELFLNNCEEVNSILQRDFNLHAYTIYYWACFDNDKLEDTWRITPFMRKVWIQNN